MLKLAPRAARFSILAKPSCPAQPSHPARARQRPLVQGALALLLGLAGSLAGLEAVAADETRDYHYSDAHLHFVDFFQQGDGLGALLDAMDEAQVDHALVTGIGVAKKWQQDAPKKPRYYMGDDAPVYWYSGTDYILAEALTRAPEPVQARFSPFITGFNPTDLNAADEIRQLMAIYPGFWKGIGEVFTRHDDLTRLTEGETPRANHPALMKVYALAAEKGLPVMVHSNITSKREGHEGLYLEEFESAVRDNPETTFIWAHAGTSAELNRRLGRMTWLHGEIERMLETYPNLNIDLSWSVLEPYLLDDEGQPRSRWVALVERFPQRFVLGSDVVGRFGSVGDILASYTPFLDALSPQAARNVARDNFLRWVNLPVE
tara:strand:+ start:1101 stop:2228 length:1128 start_codon:yes stop_codon:yes gene_type:complete